MFSYYTTPEDFSIQKRCEYLKVSHQPLPLFYIENNRTMATLGGMPYTWKKAPNVFKCEISYKIQYKNTVNSKPIHTWHVEF